MPCMILITIKKKIFDLKSKYFGKAVFFKVLTSNISMIHSEDVSFIRFECIGYHYSNIIMSMMASQITGISIVCSTVCSGADQRKHHNSTSRAFVRGIHWALEVSTHKGPVTKNVSIWLHHHDELTSVNFISKVPWLHIDVCSFSLQIQATMKLFKVSSTKLWWCQNVKIRAFLLWYISFTIVSFVSLKQILFLADWIPWVFYHPAIRKLAEHWLK